MDIIVIVIIAIAFIIGLIWGWNKTGKKKTEEPENTDDIE